MFIAGSPFLRVFLAAGLALLDRAAPVSKDGGYGGPEVTGPPPLSPYVGSTQRPCTGQEFYERMKALNDDTAKHCDFM
ncbi:hypothetical protein AAVH_29254 [Aphelenchoides avenae]|nr:hypothetical protein AAVH_29254 [Aphelenchus avenae]